MDIPVAIDQADERPANQPGWRDLYVEARRLLAKSQAHIARLRKHLEDRLERVWEAHLVDEARAQVDTEVA